MLLIVGTIRLPADQVDAARPAMAQIVAASRAEHGCMDYAYTEDVIDRGLIHVRERWQDRAALDAHFATAHLASWREAWPRFGFSDRDLVLYDVGDPQPT